MSSIAPINTAEIEFDNGNFDSAAFAAQTLSTWQSLASVIDHTILKADATRDQVVATCEEAARYRFACAMINPIWVSTAAGVLLGTGVPVGVVVGFPLGASLVSSMRVETESLLRMGAKEIDMVLPIGQLKSGNNQAVKHSIQSLAEVTHAHGGLLKVIFETCLLTVEEKLRAAEIAIEAGADFLKTSTGFSTGGATVADIELLRGVAGSRCGVKASGGIRTFIGASASIAIVRELGAEGSAPAASGSNGKGSY